MRFNIVANGIFSKPYHSYRYDSFSTKLFFGMFPVRNHTEVASCNFEISHLNSKKIEI